MCEAKLIHRGVEVTCSKWHQEGDSFDAARHHSDGAHGPMVYWQDGETERLQCTATASYCGEELRCDCDAPCREFHTATSVRFARIAWNDEKRPQPAVMFQGLCLGHLYGSHEADSLMLAAATMQDAANRLEYYAESTRYAKVKP